MQLDLPLMEHKTVKIVLLFDLLYYIIGHDVLWLLAAYYQTLVIGTCVVESILKALTEKRKKKAAGRRRFFSLSLKAFYIYDVRHRRIPCAHVFILLWLPSYV